jgi:hypothetical protein
MQGVAYKRGRQPVLKILQYIIQLPFPGLSTHVDLSEDELFSSILSIHYEHHERRLRRDQTSRED